MSDDSITLGAHPIAGGTRFAVRAPRAEAVTLCLFGDDTETRHPMRRQGEVWTVEAAVGPGQRYGYRADGDCEHGFDASKLLVDPHAVELDRRFVQHPRLATFGEDTTDLVPRAIVPAAMEPVAPPPPLFRPGGLIYELNVRGFTMRHPDVPEAMRGTVAALAQPAVIAHLKRLHVSAVELMPIVAWIDERHLPPLGLTNAWGYNPVALMALDPGLAPGGVTELRDTVATLRAAGIGVILDLVFNHTGESDAQGPTLSLRGLDDAAYARAPDGTLINDTGTGNTLDAANPAVRALILDALRHFTMCGVDGFRFDLATVLARGPGFDPEAPIFAEIAADPLLADRVMIAEPWDTGPGGYQLGRFPDGWLEWNDRYRDDVRRFWRGDGRSGDLATRLAGSADVFPGEQTRTVNFLATHDGFTLADLVAHAERHNQANGEDNRDGHAHEVCWNNGVEGPTDDPDILARRAADQRALLTALFASKGTILLTAGDEFGRTQSGNNNAYAQDNATTWLDWTGRDQALEAFVADLAQARAAMSDMDRPDRVEATEWLTLDGDPMTPEVWDAAETPGFKLCRRAAVDDIVVTIDRSARSANIVRA